MFAQCILSLFQLSLGLVLFRPGMLPLLLCIKDGVLTALHHLTCLFKFIMALGEVLLALSSRADSLLVFLSQSIDLMLHVRKPQPAYK